MLHNRSLRDSPIHRKYTTLGDAEQVMAAQVIERVEYSVDRRSSEQRELSSPGQTVHCVWINEL
jgi:hypothetical protein